MRRTYALACSLAMIAMLGCQRDSPPLISGPPADSSTTREPYVGDRDVSDDAFVSSTRSRTSLASVRPFPIVMYDSANKEQLKPYAERIAKLIGVKVVQASPRNPVCCVWLELTRWTPNPGKQGYIINNQAGGSIIQASDEEQLRIAIERFESSAQRHGDYVEVPAALLTSYDVYAQANVTEQSDARETSAQSVLKSESTPRSP